jgi:isopenicillin N synthase-like dioxygenase
MPDIHSLSRPLNANLSSDRLPLIDISSYLNPSSTKLERQVTANALDKACREYGKSFSYETE